MELRRHDGAHALKATTDLVVGGLRRSARAWVGRLDEAGRRATAALDRPGFRGLLRIVATVVASAVHRQRCRAEPLGDGLLALRFADGIVVARSPWTRVPARTREITLETFCWSYTPGPGDVVLDLGAGIGEEATTFSELVGNDGRVFCVEAHPSTYVQLVLSCELNRLDNVRCEQVAIADHPGEVRIADSSGPSHAGASLATDDGVVVLAETVDGLVERLGLERIDLLKMNIEGAERLAIAAMDTTLARTRHLVISCHDFLVPLFGADPVEMATFDRVRDFLVAQGYEVLSRPDDPRPWIPYFVYARRRD